MRFEYLLIRTIVIRAIRKCLNINLLTITLQQSFNYNIFIIVNIRNI